VALFWRRETDLWVPLGVPAGAAGLPVGRDISATFDAFSKLYENKYANPTEPSRLGVGTPACIFQRLATKGLGFNHNATGKLDLARNWFLHALKEICMHHAVPPFPYRNDIIGKLAHRVAVAGAAAPAWPAMVLGVTGNGGDAADDVLALYAALPAASLAEIRAFRDWSAAQIL